MLLVKTYMNLKHWLKKYLHIFLHTVNTEL